MNSFTRLRPVTRTLYFRREGYTQKIVCSRVAKRMTGWKHELKLKPMACDRIQELAAIYQELREAPISDKPSKPPFVEPLHHIHKWQRGDKVIRLLTQARDLGTYHGTGG